MSFTAEPHTPQRNYAIASIIFGAIGWFSAFQLLTEFIKTLQNSDYVPNCSVSLLVTCGPNMASWQGSILGFSNTIIGVAAFTAPVLIGVALLAGARFAPWFWACYQIGLLGGFVFVCWLQFQSIYVLGTLCPWCMVAWVAMIPLWWISAFRPYATGNIPVSSRLQPVFTSLHSWVWVFIVVNVFIVALLAQLRLDWFAEFARM